MTEAITETTIEVDALADRIAVAAAHIDAATHTLLSSIRAFDDAAGGSCTALARWRTG